MGSSGVNYVTAAAAAATYLTQAQPLLVASGEETFARDLASTATLTTNTGVLRLTYFYARKTEVTTQVRTVCGSTPATGSTLCRLGLYTVDPGSGDLTLVASTANDAALWSVANTAYVKAWSVAYAKTAGQLLALGLMCVTAGTAPTMLGNAPLPGNSGETLIAPRMGAQITGQPDLPANIAAGGLVVTGQRFYGLILP